jgi:hypothetical protein
VPNIPGRLVLGVLGSQNTFLAVAQAQAAWQRTVKNLRIILITPQSLVPLPTLSEYRPTILLAKNPALDDCNPVEQASLKRQLELARFERALEVTESLADHRALLTTAELARLNSIITGKNDDPWRRESVTITLPSGRKETLALIVDPVLTARDKLHRVTEVAEGGAVIDAAVDIYAGLVLAHVFHDANRRTAVLASHYFLKRYGVPVSGVALHELGLGDLREEGQIEALRDTVHQITKFAEKRMQHSKKESP